jgi:hypothetical protein
MTESIADKLAGLKPATRGGGPRGLSRADGVAIIRALRNGCTVDQVGAAMGIPDSNRANLYSALGTWARRYADIGAEEPR